MKVLVAANNKGGVGKTLVTGLVAEFSSMKLGKRVLILDLDDQCNSSLKYLQMEGDPHYKEGWLPPLHPDYDPTSDEDKDWDGRSSIADIFFQGGIVPYPTYVDKLDISPAHAHNLLIASQVRRNEVVEKIHNRLLEFLSLPEVQSSYDLVVIDTPPSKGPMTVSAIKAATHIIIPVEMEEQPINGIFGMLQLWMQESLERGNDRKLNLIGILPNKYDSRTVLHTDNYKSLKDDPSISKYLTPMIINRRIVFAEKDSRQANPKSIFDLPDKNLAKMEAVAACEFITERMFS